MLNCFPSTSMGWYKPTSSIVLPSLGFRQGDLVPVAPHDGVHDVVRALQQRRAGVLKPVLFPDLERSVGGPTHAGRRVQFEVQSVAAGGQREERVALLALDTEQQELSPVDLHRRAVKDGVAAIGHVLESDNRVAGPAVQQVSSLMQGHAQSCPFSSSASSASSSCSAICVSFSP